MTLCRKRDVADKLMILKWKIILDYLGGSFWGAALGLCRWFSGKDSTCQCRRRRRLKFDPWVRKIPWRRKWQPTPVFLPGEFHGQRSLAGYSPWGCKWWDTAEWLSTHTRVFVALCGLSLVAVRGGYSLWCLVFSLRWFLLLWSTGSRRLDFSHCTMQVQ